MNVTYYLGAGASFHSMPLQSDLEARMRVYRDYIFHEQRQSKTPFLEEYIHSVDDILKNISQSTSIDNYAKELYNAQSQNSIFKLTELKKILSHYLLFEQLPKDNTTFYTTEIASSPTKGDIRYKPYSNAIQNKIKMQFDKRYRTFYNEFFSENSNSFPNNVKIISWNYDLQLEGSYCRYYNCSLEMAQEKLNIFPSPASTNYPTIIKLNGTAGVITSGMGSSRLTNIISGFNKNLDEILLDYISNDFNRREEDSSSLSFAFEREQKDNSLLKIANDTLKETEVLIVIGYSFPKMNKRIDSAIFSNLTNPLKIFFQVSSADYEKIKGKFKSLSGISVGASGLKSDLTEFFIPDEI